jgi:hypothetical protein
MKKLILLAVAVYLPLSNATIEEIFSAKIDGRRGVLVLDVLTDCNGAHSPSLKYLFSTKRADGPHYYALDYISTEIGCPGFFEKKTIEVKLPALKPGQTVVIKADGGETFIYKTSNPQRDEVLKEAKEHLAPDDKNPEAAR